MPTHEQLPEFMREWRRLSNDQREAFKHAVKMFVADLASGTFRKGLRVKRVQGTAHIWELTWARDGRATWQYGNETRPGEPHSIWRRIGGHDIFGRP